MVNNDDDLIDRLQSDYSFSPVVPEVGELLQVVRDDFLALALRVIDQCPEGRSRSLALTNLQQAKMWAVQAIVDEQTYRENLR